MKKLFFYLLLLVTVAVQAQKTDTVPAFKKSPYIPAFTILQSDSTSFTKMDLPKHRPVVIIYFSPDCGHCQLTAQEFSKKMDELKDVFFVWVSYHSPDANKKFAEDYGLNKFTNVRLGKDTKYFLPVFYDVKFTPFIAAYDKNGKLLNTYPAGTDPETLVRLIHPSS